MNSTDDRLMRVREVAEMLQLSERRVFQMIRDEELPAKRYGGRWRLEREAVLAAGDPKRGGEAA